MFISGKSPNLHEERQRSTAVIRLFLFKTLEKVQEYEAHEYRAQGRPQEF